MALLALKGQVVTVIVERVTISVMIFQILDELRHTAAGAGTDSMFSYAVFPRLLTTHRLSAPIVYVLAVKSTLPTTTGMSLLSSGRTFFPTILRIPRFGIEGLVADMTALLVRCHLKIEYKIRLSFTMKLLQVK